MIRISMVAALLAGSALVHSAPALAAQEQPAAQDVAAEPDPSDATADAAIAAAAPVDDAQAKIELLQAQVEALQEALEGVKAAMVKTTPSWKGAPLFEDKGEGWSFKPRGRIQYDAGYVSNPGDNILTRNLGFNTRARRIRLGVEGTIPGDFAYKMEADFANSAVGFGDVILTYAPKERPYSFTVGNHETMNGLEQITSSRFISFLERAAFNDAFVNTRRIGISMGLVNKDNTLRFNAGVFAGKSIDGGFDNEGMIFGARGVYAPLMGANQLHFGANYQHRNFQSNNGATVSNSIGAPSTNQLARYRARPFTQTTDVRFVDTGAFAANSDNIFGLEFGGIFKSLHVSAEGQYIRVNSDYEPGDIRSGLDQFAPNSAGVPSYVVPTGNPTFWGGYVEAGYFLTGETRGYKNGTWDRTKVLKPFSKGGWGAWQAIGRIDYLDLDSNKLKNALTNNFATGATSLSSSRLGRGGTQLGLLAGLTWIPEDYMRVLFNYSRAQINGGPQATTAKPDSDKDADDIKYGVHVFTTRFQIDF